MYQFIHLINENVNPERVGQKAYNLIKLSKMGVRIPASVFLSPGAYSFYLKKNSLLKDLNGMLGINPEDEIRAVSGNLQNAFLKADVPLKIRSEIESGVSRLNLAPGDTLAVRSSGLSEDLTDQSFAGQYDSVLNVRNNPDDILNAVKMVWSSQFNPRNLIYQKTRGMLSIDQGPGVIIQKMIQSDLAGVLFTVNPSSGNQKELMIEYVEGTGDTLVSGEATPERIIINKKALLKRSKDLNINDLYIRLASHALKLEKKFGFPLDLEWAIRDHDIYFLQARPVTAKLRPADEIIWTDENVGEVIPDIVTPYTWSLLNPLTNGAFKHFLKRVGIRSYPDEGLFGLYKGKVYLNKTALENTLNIFYLSTYKGIHKKLLLLKSLIYIGFFSIKLPGEIKNLLKSFPEQLMKLRYLKRDSAKESFDKIIAIRDLQSKIMTRHIAGTIFGEIYYQLLNKWCSTWIKPQIDISADMLLTGLNSADSARSGAELRSLADVAAKNKRIAELFIHKKNYKSIEAELMKTPEGKEIFSLIDQFIEKYGHNSFHEFELYYPRWREDPGIVYLGIRRYLQGMNSKHTVREFSALADERKRNISLALRSISGLGKTPKKLFFNYVLKRTEFFTTFRENLKQALIHAHSELKKHVLSIAEISDNNHSLSEPLDILFLTHGEIEKIVVTGNEFFAYIPTIQKRKEERIRMLSEMHPAVLRQIGGQWIPAERHEFSDGDLYSGIGCSGGIVEGFARVLDDPETAESLKKNEILITKSTNPGWTPLFVNASAVVTEIGGALSHGAIIAREYGLPMVTAVTGITKVIKTGDRIRVDGGKGEILILERTDKEMDVEDTIYSK
ncbi:MAG: PEP/pyruvate-binding domain-containing protein [Calditrichaceae bacterium]